MKSMTKKQANFFLLVLFTSQVVLAKSEVPKEIEKLVESSRLKTSQLGMVVLSPDGTVFYNLNGEKKFIPASLTKIVTGAAVLEKMPVGKQFFTEILANEKDIKNGVITGDVYLRGGGDAGFVSESMWFLVNEFKRSAIKEIKGHIIVDDTQFDNIRFDASRDQERVDRAYDAPIGAMTFNWSAVNIFVRPGKRAGDLARVFVDPENSYIRVINNVKTVSGGGSAKVTVSNTAVRNGTITDEGVEEVKVSGNIGLLSKEFVAYKSVTQPEIWAGVQLIEFFKQRQIKVSAGVRRGVTSKSAIVLAQYKSKPVSDLVIGMMKYSNNYIAEILTKNLGVEMKGAPGTMEKGLEVIREFMISKGLSTAEIYSPSGLSRKNKFSPNDIVKILSSVKDNMRVYPEYLSSLPIAGVDGTLKRRANGGEEFAGHVRAKTGHLAGVSGLGGFISGKAGQIYSFAFIFNGTPGDDPYRASELFDNVILKLLKQEH